MNKLIVNTEITMRLDRYLKRQYPSLSQGIIEKMLRKKNIKLNNMRATSSQHVHQGDVIAVNAYVNFSLSEGKIVPPPSLAAIALAKKILKEYLIFENDYFLAINKPAGIACQGGSKINLSICESLTYLNNKKGLNLKLVHRLDKNTSGVLLIAKGYTSAVKLTKAFKEQQISKQYLAILEGCPDVPQGIIDNHISKDDGKEKSAITKYQVLQNNSKFSLVKFSPLTGRTHQLRLHAKHLGTPIVGDVKYGGHISEETKSMMLHAQKLLLNTEIFGQEFEINAPLPENFLVMLNKYFQEIDL